MKKTYFQLFVILLTVMMFSSFALARSEKKDKKEGKKIEQVKKEKKKRKKSDKELWNALLMLQEQINTLAEELDSANQDFQGQIDELAAGQQNQPAEGETPSPQSVAPPLVCPGCLFPATSLPQSVMDRLQGAFLVNAVFNGTDLSGADFSDSNLTLVGFIYADLTGGNLSGADLTNSYWYGTTCPDGSNSDDNGGTCEGH